MKSYIQMDSDSKKTKTAGSPIAFCKEYLSKHPYLSDQEKADLQEIVNFATGICKNLKTSYAIVPRFGRKSRV
jgi:hypothetical protein